MRTTVALMLVGSLASAEALTSAEHAGDHAAEARLAAAFARDLVGQADFYRAIGEYKRALFLDPEAAEAPAWALGIGEAYRLGDQGEAAAKQYEAVAKEYGPAVQGPALLGAAKGYLAAGQVESAVERARQAVAAYEGDEGRVREARYVEGWALLKAHRDDEAAAAFAAARGPGRIGDGATKLVALLPQLKTLPSKSPELAGVLGLVPGLGHLYIGEPGTAASALVWNGLFVWALVEAVQEKQWSLAAVLGVFETMWYGGSIVGAVSGAHRYNRDARVNAMEDLSRVAGPGLPDEMGVRRE